MGQSWMQRWGHLLLLGVWTLLGMALRLTHLGDKPAASIEISTLGFSLGQGFRGVPLNQLISLETLLSPLQFDPALGGGQVIDRLLSETNHPPLYFLLTHGWLQVWRGHSGLELLQWGRCLSALLGTAAIPAVFGLGWLTGGSRLAGQLAAALMAVSPYGIYLAQEARHYGLSILWAIASLACLIVALRSLRQRTNLSIALVCSWIVVNALGIATHYFFVLTRAAAGVVVAVYWLRDWQRHRQLPPRYWWRLYLVVIATALSGLIWLGVARSLAEPDLTDWIATRLTPLEIWQPLPRLLGWILTMVVLLPVEGTPLAVTVVAALGLLMVVVWAGPTVVRSWRAQMNAAAGSAQSLQDLTGVLASAIGLFLVIIYGLGKDLSLAPRYSFVYFPVVIVGLGCAQAGCWQTPPQRARSWPWSWMQPGGRSVVVGLLVIGCLGALTVVTNHGYQKSQRADLLAAEIEASAAPTVVVAMNYQTHAELRALMAVGLELERQPPVNGPQFLLVQPQSGGQAGAALASLLTPVSRPLELWTINFQLDQGQLDTLQCHPSAGKPSRRMNGYRVRVYECSQNTVG
jgi:uncharacterized membrane protein